MKKQPFPRKQADGHAGASRTPDRWLLTGSLLFHLIVFLLLPSFTTEAKQPIQLLIEIVKPEVKPKPVKPSGVKNPRSAAKSVNQPVDEQPAKQEPEIPQETVPDPAPAQLEAETPAIKQEQSAAATTAPIPEMVAVPTHQPVVIPPPADPVVEQTKPEPTLDPIVEQPAPIEDAQPMPAAQQPQVQPILPAPASSTGNTTPSPKPAETAEATPNIPEKPAGGSAKPKPTDGVPEVETPGQPAIGEEESAGPPAPSALELGMLGDYGDGARKKIRMLVRTPELAREQGLKGKCTFEFELRSDGTLVGIKVLESSSHAVLDEECLEATRVAMPYKRFPGGVSVDSWKFKMELVFPTY